MNRLILQVGGLLLLALFVRSFKLLQYGRLAHGLSSNKLSLSAAPSLVDLNKPAASQACKGPTPQFVFVGGKGGVGKTTSSSAMALSFSDNGHRTLVVSTDPAHSLGDALDVDLKSGNVVNVPSTPKLWALEIDTQSALDDFKDAVQGLSGAALAKGLGIPKDLLDSFGIDDITGVFKNPPPGVDEIVALTKIFAFADPNQQGLAFDRIVIDTAPTGHTVRLLQLPAFLGTLTGKLIRFRSKILGAVRSFQSLFGGGQDQNEEQSNVMKVLDKLESLQADVAKVRDILRSPDQTQFVVVSIATQLAVLESRRLLSSLQQEDICVSALICNQVIDSLADGKYLESRMASQRQSLTDLRDFLSSRAQQHKQPVVVTEVPYLDTEITGVHSLRHFSTLAHNSAGPADSKKLTIFGGKGGVGKTTSATSWAVKLSDSGLKTLIVSSDPAHSLGDALAVQLSGQPLLIDGTCGQLWAMEIDPAAALNELKEMVGSSSESAAMAGGMFGLPDMKAELSNLLLDVKDPPPGTDEIAAMAKVVSFLDRGIIVNGQVVHFDRIVLDTAPTGHTLRMLELPAFIHKLLQQVKRIKAKSANSLLSMFGDEEEESSAADDKLQAFENSMTKLDSILHDSRESEFTLVTIPTGLAVAETQRLLTALDESEVPVRRAIVNQVVIPTAGDGSATGFLNKVRAGQAACLKELQQVAVGSGIPLITVPYFDAEMRGVEGLRTVGNEIFPGSNAGALVNE